MLMSLDEIREDLEDVVSRMKPWLSPEGETQFGGWARMALPVNTFSVVEVGQPKVGENKPSRVRADISFDMNVTDRVKTEWESKNTFFPSLLPISHSHLSCCIFCHRSSQARCLLLGDSKS